MVEKVHFETFTSSKTRKFLFWKLRHKKDIVKDEILDGKGNLIMKSKSVFISSNDAIDDKRFRRLQVKNNEIWKFYANKSATRTKIRRYDFCGKYLGKKEWLEGDFFQIGRSNLAK